MKKLVVLTMVVAVFNGIPLCVFAQEEPPNASKICKQFAADSPDEFTILFKNLGYCLSSLQACWKYENPPEWCLCRQLRYANPQEYEARFGTQGLGPCIAYYRTHP